MSIIKPRTARVVIYQGDDIETLSALDDRVETAATDLAAAEHKVKTARREAEKSIGVAPPRLLGEIPETVDDHPDVVNAAATLHTAQEKHDAAAVERDQFAAQAEVRGVVVVLIARPRLRWRELMRAHQARPDNDDDKVFGVNMDTLPDELLPESVDVAMSTIDGNATEFLNSLNDYDYYNRLFLAAWSINRGSTPADPTQRLLSVSSQTSAATSS